MRTGARGRSRAARAEPAAVFITALLLVLLGINLTFLGVLGILHVLRLDPLDTMTYFGLAELDRPRVPRRR